MPTRRYTAVLALVLTASSAVATSADDRVLPSGRASTEKFGSVLRNSRWRQLSIEVCWQDFGPADVASRAVVRQAVHDTWEAVHLVSFAGWGACSGPPRGIRIAVVDETDAPHVDWYGRFIAGREPGMVLNFTFQHWRTQCQSTRDFCIYAVAAHEFGHALGFTHEQNRTDAPDWCREKAQGAVGDYNVTDYDPKSIMNYCNEHWLGDGKLSSRDVEALRTVYGAS